MAVVLLILVALLGGAAEARALPATAGVTCSEVSGQVSFHGLRIQPDTPAVGDDVELAFDFDAFVYSLTRLDLQGASPLLAGDTSLSMTRNGTFRLTAVQAGSATVQLVVTYGTEEQCVDEHGYTYFREGPDRSVMSPGYPLTVVAAAPFCVGDCNGDGRVTIDELTRGVRVTLAELAPDRCVALDANRNGSVSVNELVAAVDAALLGCGPAPPSPARTATPTPTNPPGSCCCGNYSFVDCEAVAATRPCVGWSDPCPTETPPLPSPATRP